MTDNLFSLRDRAGFSKNYRCEKGVSPVCPAFFSRLPGGEMLRSVIAGTFLFSALASAQSPTSVKAILGDFVTITLDSKTANAQSATVTVDQPPPAKGAPAMVHCQFNAWISTDNKRIAFALPAGANPCPASAAAFTAGAASFSIALNSDQKQIPVGSIPGRITVPDKPRQPAITSVQVHDAQINHRDLIDFTVYGVDLDPRDDHNDLLLADATKATDADLLTASVPISAGPGQCPDTDTRRFVAVNPGYSLRFCGPVSPELASRLKVGLRVPKLDGSETVVWSQTAIPMPSIGRRYISWLAVLTTLVLGLIIVVIVGQGKRHKVEDKQYNVFQTFFIEAETDTYSLSKVQFMLWTAAALFAYAYVTLAMNLVQRIFGFPPFPDNFPGIIGLGAGTTVGSMAITSAKGPKGAGEIQPSVSDLVTSGGVVAADRAQYLLWTVFSVIGFVLLVWRSDAATVSGVPDIPAGLLTISGIGALGYLGGKMVRKPGPVIDEIAIEPAAADPAPGAPTNPPPDRAKALADARSAVTAAADNGTKIQPSVTGLPQSALQAGVQAKAALTALNNLIAQARTVLQAADAGKPVDSQPVAAAADQIDTAARAAAAEFKKITAAKDPNAKDANTAAGLAQQATLAGDKVAAAFKTLAAAFTTPAAAGPSTQLKRTITLRGRNLSRRGTFRIDSADLPFRMLTDESETDASKRNQPQLVQPDSNTAEPDMGAVLKLTIQISLLNDVDQKTVRPWFVSDANGHDFTILNPDGQKSVINYKIPPGEAQK